MSELNWGARQSPERQYDESAIRNAVKDTQVDEHLKTAVERQTREALDWCHERGNAGDGAPQHALTRLQAAASGERLAVDRAISAAVDVLSGRQHPTAREICSAPAKHLIYNLTGRRAHNFRTDSSN